MGYPYTLPETLVERVYAWLVKVGVLKVVTHRHPPSEPCTPDCRES